MKPPLAAKWYCWFCYATDEETEETACLPEVAQVVGVAGVGETEFIISVIFSLKRRKLVLHEERLGPHRILRA